MDVGSPERFEIELVEQAPRRSRFRNRPEPAVPPAPSVNPSPTDDIVFTPASPPDAPDGSRGRTQLVVTALAAGAVALFLGWSLGRAGDDEAARTGGTAASTEPRPDAAPATTVEATTDTLPEASLPATTRPRAGPATTTTTVPPAWVESQVQIDVRLEGQADRIVGVTDGGGLVELDVADGTLRTLELDHPSGASPLAPVAGDDWVVVSFDDSGSQLLFQDGDVRGTPIGSSDPWSTLWQPAADVFWRMDWSGVTGQPNQLMEYSVTGVATGRTLDTRGLWVSQVDFTGGFVIGDGSIGAYRLMPDGTSELLADGYVMAIGVNHLVVYRCGETFHVCSLAVVDRGSGEVRDLALGDEMTRDVLGGGGLAGVATTPSINTDGTGLLFALQGPERPPTPAILDLEAGEVVWQGDPSFAGLSSGGAWSADGRFAYVAQDDRIVAVELATGDSFDVAIGDVVTDVRAITVRPA